MSRFNPTDKLALPSPALHLYWRPAQRQALGSAACQSNTLTAYPGFSFRDRRVRLPCGCCPPRQRAIYIRKGLTAAIFDGLEQRLRKKGLVNYSLITSVLVGLNISTGVMLHDGNQDGLLVLLEECLKVREIHID